MQTSKQSIWTALFKGCDRPWCNWCVWRCTLRHRHHCIQPG